MADQSRNYLKQSFDDGERPTGKDFADLIDSFINKESDNVRLLVNNNLSIPGGLILSDTSAGPEGTLRYNNNNVEVFSSGEWKQVGGESGAFTPVGDDSDVAFAGGNVGIGDFSAAPTHKLDVPLAANTGPAQRIRLGQLTAHNGTGNDGAYLSHESTANTNQNYALKQDAQANTTVNAGPGARLALANNDTIRFQILNSGNITMSPAASVAIDGNVAIGAPAPAPQRNLLVFGNASKPGGGPFLDTGSDMRIKKDIKPLGFGLKEVCKLKPVFYKFNGDAGLPDDGKEYVGLIAQDLQKVLPFMVKKAEEISSIDKEKRDLLTYDSGPLIFILVNAIRELTDRVEKLEAQLAAKNG